MFARVRLIVFFLILTHSQLAMAQKVFLSLDQTFALREIGLGSRITSESEDLLVTLRTLTDMIADEEAKDRSIKIFWITDRKSLPVSKSWPVINFDDIKKIDPDQELDLWITDEAIQQSKKVPKALSKLEQFPLYEETEEDRGVHVPGPLAVVSLSEQLYKRGLFSEETLRRFRKWWTHRVFDCGALLN